jgi:hypothetical protein
MLRNNGETITLNIKYIIHRHIQIYLRWLCNIKLSLIFYNLINGDNFGIEEVQKRLPFSKFVTQNSFSLHNYVR